MLFTDTSFGTCTSLRPPSSQPRNPLQQMRPEVVEELPEPGGEPLEQVAWRTFSGSSAMSLTTCLILATRAQNAAGGMPRSSSSPSMMNLTGSSTKRLIALTIRPMSPPAFLRSSATSARTSSTAALERSTRSLLKLSRAAMTSVVQLSSCPSNFACSCAAQPFSDSGRSEKIFAIRSRAFLMISSHAAMTELTFVEIARSFSTTRSPNFFSASE